jgi:hypothetical protein
MSYVPETADMRELNDKAIPPGQFSEGKDLPQEPPPREKDLSSGSQTQDDTAHFSPDPMRRTDRYRLAQPFNIPL